MEIEMRKPFPQLVFVVLLLALASLACNFSASTANISSATLARDPDGQQATTVFAPQDTFYLIVELANAPDDTTVRAVWTAIEAEGVDPNFFIDEAELTSGSATLTFDLANNQPWPPGRYKVDLYLNGELEQTLEFTVQAG
jgi:hypothetical protein